jgi:type IV secretion system protein VirD4
VLVASSKPDIFQATVTHRLRDGPVWLFTLIPTSVDPRSGIRVAAWSPLPGCEDWDRALQRARSMTTAEARNGDDSDRFFRSQAERALAALLHAAALTGYGMEDVARWVLVGDLEEPVAILAERGSAWAAGLLRGFDRSDPRLRDSILVTAADTIRVYDSELARNQADGPLIPVREFLADSGTIYIVAPSDVHEQFASLVVGLLDEVRRTTYACHSPGRPTTLLVLDEADKIAPWPKLPSVLGEGGSQGLQVCMAVQDLSQARTRWGGATDGFPTLFQHKVLLGGVADRTTLENLSAVLGEEPVPGATHTATRPLWPPHKLAAPPPGMAIHIDGVRAEHVCIVRHHDLGGR